MLTMLTQAGDTLKLHEINTSQRPARSVWLCELHENAFFGWSNARMAPFPRLSQPHARVHGPSFSTHRSPQLSGASPAQLKVGTQCGLRATPSVRDFRSPIAM